jgi:diguanylate cyclase (GGDEF)-like protein
MVARYGGEEFVVLLPEADHASAMAVGETLRAGVAEFDMPHPASPVAPHVTISVGVATAVAGPALTFAKLLEHADQALYACKRGGRNRVGGVELGG